MSYNLVVKGESYRSYVREYAEALKNVKRIFSSMSELMKEIDGHSEVWKSKTALAVHEKFSQLEGSFDGIHTKLEEFETFMNHTLESYEQEEAKLEKVVEEGQDKFDVGEWR